jgi:hypothetical protein
MRTSTSTKHRRRSIRAFAAIGALLASVAVAGTAAAEPQAAVVRLPPAAKVELARDVARARAADVRPFVAVQQIVASAETAHARARGRRAPIALYLAKLGPSALMPMLEMLALDAPKGVSAKAARTIRRDLVEAVGLLRDPRALPVLSAILDDASADEDTTRTAAEAIARLGTDEAATRIIRALETATDDRARAILGGMGECRRARVADAIAVRLRSATDEATARVAARSLGRAGNAWAWRTMADRTEESRVREIAARALVAAFVQRDGEARTAADNALMVVDAPQTPALIEEAKKGAPAETVKALDELAARFAKNPSR